MDEKQKQQHRQHFNLSESAKQMLDELTARRYPGRQRRQSQLVEDLITEAFGKEQNMSTVTTGMHEPGPERFAPSTRQAIAMARQEAARMDAAEVYLAAHSTSATNLCPSCKREIQSKWKHCVYCGASLTRVCPKCGAVQPGVEGAKYCFECGGELG